MGFFVATLIANSFHLFFSALFLLMNNLLTTLVVASEWNGYILERKTLRLSSPLGIQRSSYFLSLPYRYGIPAMLANSVLHWMTSQSFFVVQTVAYDLPDFTHRNTTFDSSSIGYSSIGSIFCLFIWSIMVFGLLFLATKKSYKNNTKIEKDDTYARYPMPLVRTCSAAISAACHAHPDDKDVCLLPVRWGWVREEREQGTLRPGRWRFTTAKVIEYPANSM